MNIDKTKTNDEIEDYLYDSYPDAEIETFKVFRHVPYRVLVIFNSKAKADQFLEMPIVQGEKIGFNDKIKQYMKDNHDEVTGVDKTGGNDVLLTFKEKESVEKFIALSYVKCCGQLITRQKSVAPAKEQKKTRGRGENKKKIVAAKGAVGK